MSHPLVMEAAEVAQLLGVAEATLPAKSRRLREKANFPPPLPGRANAWSRARIEQWVEDPENAGTVRPSRDAARVAQHRATLEARYAGGQG